MMGTLAAQASGTLTLADTLTETRTMQHAAPRRRALSLQARIALTVTLLAVLMLVIGALGLQGSYHANRANRDTYQNKLAAAMHIGDAELMIARTRMVLGGATSNVDAGTAQRLLARATEYFRASDDAWQHFVALIEAADQRREALRTAMLAFIAALKADDRAAAEKIGTVQLSRCSTT
jgi:methyl-accepting chemotaxis protein I, serine sensor receptor